MRSIAGRPDPRAIRAFEVSASKPAPVAAAAHAARARPSLRRLMSPRSSSTLRPDRRMSAAAAMRSSGTLGREGTGRAAAMPPPSPQAVSAGRIRLAIGPALRPRPQPPPHHRPQRNGNPATF